jgi:hypothetical protein
MPNERGHLWAWEVLAGLAKIKGIKRGIQRKSNHLVVGIDRASVARGPGKRSKIRDGTVLPKNGVEVPYSERGIAPTVEGHSAHRPFCVDVADKAAADFRQRP